MGAVAVSPVVRLGCLSAFVSAYDAMLSARRFIRCLRLASRIVTICFACCGVSFRRLTNRRGDPISAIIFVESLLGRHLSDVIISGLRFNPYKRKTHKSVENALLSGLDSS